MVGLLSGLSTPWCNVLNLFGVIIYREFWVFVTQISTEVDVTMIVLEKQEYFNYQHISTGCGQYKLLFLVLSFDYSCIPVVTMSLLLSRLSHLRPFMIWVTLQVVAFYKVCIFSIFGDISILGPILCDYIQTNAMYAYSLLLWVAFEVSAQKSMQGQFSLLHIWLMCVFHFRL